MFQEIKTERNPAMWCDAYFDLIEKYFDKDAAYENIARIYENDRFFNFPRFNQTSDFVFEKLSAAGCERLEKIPVRADGKSFYGDWALNRAWDVEEAAVTLLGGDGSPDIPLHRYTETPCMLSMFSAPTPPGGVTGEVADADGVPLGVTGNAADANGLTRPDLAGKWLLTGGPTMKLAKLAIQSKAAGILSDAFAVVPGMREASDIERACRWDQDLMYPNNDAGLVGLVLSPESGRRIRERLSEGKTVRVHAEVKSRFYDGELHTITGVIPGDTVAGETDEEILFCTHLHEPGANDNASGCGILLELARAITEMIRDGAIPRPRRTIRFVMGYEVTGAMSYALSHPAEAARTVCGIDPDMVSSAASDNGRLSVWLNPYSNASFLDTLLPFLLERYAEYKNIELPFLIRPFLIGDNVLSDPMFNIPTGGLAIHPAKSYHNSLDGMDMIDRETGKRNACIATAAVLFCASPDADRAEWLRLLTYKPKDVLGTDPLRRYMAEYRALRVKAGIERFEGEGARTKPAGGPARSPAAGNDPGGGYSYLKMDFDVRNYLDETDTRIPVRLVPGTLTFAGKFRPEEERKYRPYYNYELNCPLFWCDGRRSVSEVALLAGTELGKADLKAYQKELLDYFGLLVELGYVRWL
jgi:hypothetical protein